jgi:phosphoglucosamine mutase
MNGLQAFLEHESNFTGFTALVPVELGAVSSVVPFVTAVQESLPVVNADGAGRAVPTLPLLSYAGYGIPLYPSCLASNDKPPAKAALVFADVPFENAEAVYAGVFMAPPFDGIAGLACWMMNGATLKSSSGGWVAVAGTLADCHAVCAMFNAGGAVVDEDQILAVLALAMKESGHLAADTVVATVMSNLGLDRAMGRAGIAVVRTRVGDRYVLERMLKDGYTLGGEQSGHIIFLDHNTTGDGLITTLQVLSLMRRSGKRLSELAAAMRALPQVLINLRVKDRVELARLPRVKKTMEAIERRLDGSGRLLVRYSGTEPLLRILVEGENARESRTMAKELATTITRDGLGSRQR